MARSRKSGRAIDGVFLLDKPLGESSNRYLQRVRAIFNAKKAGHTGALDPLASGMLPICLGESTKFSQYLLDADKTYYVRAKLGIRTDTSDADGEVVETRPVTVDTEQIKQACLAYLGDSEQVPSMYSALKHEGKPLYWYARQGITVDRPARPITIFDMSVDDITDDEFALTVRVSKGTYIRSLVDDIGQDLGCGAYVTELRRTRVANYPTEKMLTFDALQALADEHKDQRFEIIDQYLLTIDSPVASLPKCELTPAQRVGIQYGQAQRLTGEIGVGEYRMYCEGRFLGVGELRADSHIYVKRLVHN